MKNIYSKNSITISYPAKNIWLVIYDVNSYSKWWPSSIKIKVIKKNDKLSGSEIEIRPYGGIPFYCEFMEKELENKLQMKYKGIYSGYGEWSLSESNNHTEVTYEINLNINNEFIKVLSIFFPIDRIHHRLMNKVLINLKKRVYDIKTAIPDL